MSRNNSSIESINILHIVSGDVWAGAEIQLFYLAISISKMADVNLYVVLLNKGVLYKKLNDRGINVLLLDENVLNSADIFIKLVKIINKIKIDVIHAHKLKEHVLGGVASLLFRKVKYIRTIHGGAEHNNNLNIRKNLLNAVDILINKFVTQCLVYVSSELQKRLVLRPGKKHVVIENGLDFNEIDNNLFSNDKEHFCNDEIKIVMIGRLVDVKRIDVFLQIAEEFNDDSNVKFYIIGDGPLRLEIEQIINNKHIDMTVCMLGFMENPLPILKNMDYMIITSDHEGLPISLLEALYLKVLVISHDVGGIADVLGNNKCGILIDNQEPVKYSDSLRDLMSNCYLYEEIVNRGFERVIRNYSSDDNAIKYYELYEDMVTGNLRKNNV